MATYIKPVLQYKPEKRERKSIYASDFGKLGIDLLLELRKTEPTNPTRWNDTLRMSAGKGVEEAMIDVLKQNNLVAQDYTQDGDSFKVEWEGVPFSMRFDAILEDGSIKIEDVTMPQSKEIKINKNEILECKSVNNKNSFDINDYINDKPRENYVGQLALYLKAKGMTRGHLFASTIDGLNYFWFVIEKIGEDKYKCGEVVIDVSNEIKRLARIWKLKDSTEIPDDILFEEKYKIPLDTINWSELSVSTIGDVRNGRKVVGSANNWKINYSQYKNMIVKLQGAELGYTAEELEIIKARTAGFSAKKK